MKAEKLKRLFADLVAAGEAHLKLRMALEKREAEYQAQLSIRQFEFERAVRELRQGYTESIKQLEAQIQQAIDSDK